MTLAHASGIGAVAGVSLNPAGPPAQALAKAHPEWFRKGDDGAPRPLGPWDSAALKGWNDPAWRKGNIHPGVMALDADWTRQGLVAHVKSQLAASVTRYGWDAIRFTDVPANIRPPFPLARHALSTDVSPVGALPPLHGGIVVQESLRFWQNGETMYRTWSEFLAAERAAAAHVRAAGGHYYARLNTAYLPPAQAYYKLVYSLIAGTHPADEIDAPGCANWGAFLTRWSGMLWDPALRFADPDKRVTVTGAKLRRFLTVREVSPTQTFVILHLVTPSGSDSIGETVFSPRSGPVTVAYRPVSGARIAQIIVVRPDAVPFETYLPKTSSVTLPPLGHWAMVIWEVVR